MIRVVGKRGKGCVESQLDEAAKKEAVYARGFTKTAWQRLLLKEKLAYKNA